jgi:uncharacterized protein (DUF342 family)
MDEIKQTLIRHGILNVDAQRIQEVIERASGKSERVGDPFAFFDNAKRPHILLFATPLQARFAIRKTILQTDLRITHADLRFLFDEKGVVYGIDWDTVDLILEKNILEQETIVASATLPIPGKDAEVFETVKVDTNARPAIREDGSVDYRQIENVNQVKKGDVLAVRNPPTPGFPGTSVFGSPLSPEPGEDLGLPAGRNTSINETETELRADLNGYVYRDGRYLCVSSVFVVEGVNFKSGNIDYQGDVVVRGDVLPDFVVKAGGNITIEGTVESARVESTGGSIVVRGSVFGKGAAVLVAKDNIRVEVAQDAKFTCGGILEVKQYIRSSEVECKELTMPGVAECSGCVVRFWERVRAGILGGKSGSPSEFILLENDREQLAQQAKVLGEVMAKIKLALAGVNHKLQLFRGHLSPERQNEKDLLLSNQKSFENNLAHAADRRKKTLRLLEMLPDRPGLIVVSEFNPPLKVSIYGHEKVFTDAVDHWQVSWKSGGIKRESL